MVQLGRREGNDGKRQPEPQHDQETFSPAAPDGLDDQENSTSERQPLRVVAAEGTLCLSVR